MSYKSLADGIFNKDQIQIAFQPRVLIRSPDARNYILKEWMKKVIDNCNLFPGTLVRVNDYNIVNNELKINTGYTTFDDYFITRTKSFQKKFSNELSANPLSVGIIIVTNDNYVLLGKRKEKGSQEGKLTLPSGMVDNEDIQNNMVDVFGAIKREVWEETGISDTKLRDLLCYRLILNKIYGQTYMAFFAYVNLPAVKIQKLKRKDDEIDFAFEYFCKNEKETLKQYLDENKNMLSDIAEPSLRYYLDVFDKIKK